MRIVYPLKIADTIIFKLTIPLSNSVRQRLRQCREDIILRIGDEIENISNLIQFPPVIVRRDRKLLKKRAVEGHGTRELPVFLRVLLMLAFTSAKWRTEVMLSNRYSY